MTPNITPKDYDLLKSSSFVCAGILLGFVLSLAALPEELKTKEAYKYCSFAISISIPFFCATGFVLLLNAKERLNEKVKKIVLIITTAVSFIAGAVTIALFFYLLTDSELTGIIFGISTLIAGVLTLVGLTNFRKNQES